jgi:hypothetical protein
VAGDGDRGRASSRPSGKCPVVPAPVKGARKLASMRDGASATLDSHGSFEEPGAYREGSQTTPAGRPRGKHSGPPTRNNSRPMTRSPSPQVTAMKRQGNCREPYAEKRPENAKNTPIIRLYLFLIVLFRYIIWMTVKHRAG